jgi:hypothetical protein
MHEPSGHRDEPVAAADSCRPTATERLLLRAALLTGPSAEEAWREWRPRVDLDRLDDASAALLPLLGWNLAQQGIHPPEAPYFRWLHHGTWAANARRQVELAALLARFSDAGIETVLLKGAALVVTDYADVGLRAMADVDVLVRHDRATAAMRCLRADGWWPLGRAPFCNAPELTVPVRHAHEFGRPTGERVDLHWHALQDSCGGVDNLFWEDARHVRVLGVETRVPGPMHRLFHVCAHGVRWSWPRHIRWIADAVTILSRVSAMDWDALIVAARSAEVARPLHDALFLLRGEFDAPVPTATLDALRATPTTRIERLRHRLEARRPGPVGAASLLVYRQWRLARRSGKWLPLIGLPGYLRRLYEIENLQQIRRLVAHGMRSRPTAH